MLASPSVTIVPDPPRTSIMEYQAIRLQIERPLARISLARASDANLIGARTLRELSEACETIVNDHEVRVVLLTAEGADFCGGWDADTFAEGFELAVDPFSCLATLPQPVVCAVQGRASSAGLEIALACDVRICSTDAHFSLPESEHGLLPRAGGGQRLARAAGRGIALAMVLAGEELDASAALRSGLVARVVDGNSLAAAAQGIAEAIAARGPIATRYAKEAIQRGADMTLDQALRYETDLTIILQTTEDRAAGVEAFVNKTGPPRFRGK